VNWHSASGWFFSVVLEGGKVEYIYGGEICRTVTPSSADRESIILFLIGDQKG
jgi:hypothetical protein